MKRNRGIRHIGWMVPALLVGFAGGAAADDLPADATVAEEAAATNEAATAKPDAAATMTSTAQAPATPAPAQTSTAATPTSTTTESTDDNLMPDGEAELMGSHEVEPSGVSFKPGKGLELKSKDGLFSLATRVRVQVLYTLEKEDGVDPMNSLALRRVRLTFSGNAFGKNNKYKFEIDANSSTPVLDYYLEFGQKRDATVRVGQYKLASNRQRVISSGNLQMVDRSIFNGEFTLDRDLGIDLRSKDFLGKGKMRYVLGVSMGQGKNNSSAQDFGMLYLARFEYLPFGMFDDYSEADFERERKFRMALGLAYAFFHKATKDRGNIGTTFADGGTADYHYAFFDMIMKYAGWSLMGEFALRTGDRDPGSNTFDDDDNPATPEVPVPAPAARDGFGWMLQTGYLIPNQPFEMVGRFSCIHDLGSTTTLTTMREAAVGLNWYFAQHPFKIQADVAQLWASDFAKGETRLRVQLQASL